MPTPVSTARQCLTEEAARVLDDAVAVARRRFHAQITSLHAISALLSLPSSLLRDACSRARSPAYSHRLQFRALDLCVSVSLDRLPSAKSSAGGSGSSEDDPPPVSNSLMAAIKRSQANQRRQPEMYQITQPITSSICSMSSIKVELKNFVFSILDDPIVSRVLGDAGFRSTEIKLAILHPPAPPPSARYFRGAGSSGERCPPLFLSNLTDSVLPISGNIPFPFPLPLAGGGGGGVGDSDGDANCRRIGDILVKNSGRNPLLVGVCAKDALASFQECLKKDKGEGVLPSQIVGLDLISLEKEMMEFVSTGGTKEVFDAKVEELSSAVAKHSEPGVVVNFGELKVLMGEDGGSEDAVKFLTLKLTALFKLHKKKMWLIGAAANYETYRKFLDRFPALETDWDLHPLPITSSRSSAGELCSKSSLMGSFVPLGGFFSMPSDLRSPLRVIKQSFTRCSLCNEKYDRELSAIMSVSVADQPSSSLPSWLQTANSDVNKARNAVAEITVEKAESNAKILEMQRKWDDICRRLHQIPKIPRPDASIVNPMIPASLGFYSIASNQRSGSGNLFANDPSSSNLYSSVSAMVPKPCAQEESPIISLNNNFGRLPKLASQASQGFPGEVDGGFSAQSSCNLSLAPDCVSSSSVSSITTELQLGTFAPTSQELMRADSHFIRGQFEHLSCSISTERPVKDKASDRVFQSSPPGPLRHCQSGDQLDQVGDYKLILQKLTENVSWQIEACSNIARIVSHRKGGNGQHRGSDGRRDTWICFTGPDRMGKKRMAGALAELMFGSRENLIAIDLSIQGRMSESHSVFDTQLPDDADVKSGRKEVVDYIARELRKKPCSVVFLDNVDKTDDLLAQRSLSDAFRTGKFPDSRGREISIANAVFLMMCSSTGGDIASPCANNSAKFSEERIMDARYWQMQIVVEHIDGETASKSSSSSTVALAMGESASHKRKHTNTNTPSTHKKPKGFLDLNMPLEEDTEEASEVEINDDIDTISDASIAWFQDFLGQVENKVAFKPFNFDALSNKLLHKMNQSLHRRSGSGVRLEVDQDVMVQILAAAWCSDQEGAVDNWINNVLSEAYVEAQIERFRPNKQTLLKLVPCQGRPVEQQAPGIRLPWKINLG